VNKKVQDDVQAIASLETGYDIPNIETFKTPEEAYESHCIWLDNNTEVIKGLFWEALRENNLV